MAEQEHEDEGHHEGNRHAGGNHDGGNGLDTELRHEVKDSGGQCPVVEREAKKVLF